MQRGKNCRETIFCRSIAAQLPSVTAGAILKEQKKPSLVGEAFWEAFEETIWVRVIASQKIAARQWSQFLPRGIKMSRRALWE